MLKILLILFSIFILFSNEQIFGQEFDFSLFSPEKFAKPQGEKVGIESIEPSAIVAIENGDFLLIADDKNPELLVVSRKKSVVVGTASCDVKTPTCNLFPPKNSKWEAMAQDGDEIYIIGAFRKNENNEKNLLSFKIKKETESKFMIHSVIKFEITNIFGGISDSDPRVEGLAIRKCGDNKELLIGIRNKDVDNKKNTKAERRIFVRKLIKNNKLNSFTIEPFFDFDPKLAQNDNFPFHLSSLEYITQLKGFLIVTSTEEEGTNKFFGNALWFMSNDEIKKRSYKPIKITKTDFAPDMKAEGLCLLSNSGNKYRLAIVFDNDKRKDSELYFYDLAVTSQPKLP